MKLLLTSGGVTNDSIRASLVRMLGKPISDSSALFIPTAQWGQPACTPESVWRSTAGRWPGESDLTQLGWKSIGVLELTALPTIGQDRWEPWVRDADVLLVDGGEAVYLAQWLRDSGLAALLPSLPDTVWVGVSAGSMALSPRVGDEFVDWKPGQGDETLGVVDFSIFPHLDYPGWEENTRDAAKRWAAGIRSVAYAIDDQTAISVVDGNVEVVSEGTWERFNAERAGRLLVVCKDDQTLEVIDLTSGVVESRIRASGFTPHEVAATSDGRRAYLPIYSDAYLGDPGTDGRAIDVVDLAEMRVERSIALDFASRPHLPIVGRDGLLYVGTELDESISVFDPSSGERVARLPTERPQSHMFVLSPDGTRAYSANVDSGSVSIIDVASESVIDVVDVAVRIQRISISPDGNTVFTADQEQPRIAAIDVATKGVTWIDLPSRGFGTAVTPDGRFLVVALRWDSQIGIVDLTDPSEVTVVDVPAHPQVIVIHPDGTHAYSACDAANQVVEVDLRGGQVSRLFDTGNGSDGICWVS